MGHQLKRILITGAVGYTLPIFLIFVLAWLPALGVALLPDQIRNWSMFLMNPLTSVVCAFIGLAIGAMWVWRIQRNH